MADSGSAFRDQHDVDEVNENEDLVENHNDPLTPETVDDNDIEVGSNEVDEPYKDAFGNAPGGKTLKQEVDEDEKALAKDLTQKQQD